MSKIALYKNDDAILIDVDFLEECKLNSTDCKILKHMAKRTSLGNLTDGWLVLNYTEEALKMNCSELVLKRELKKLKDAKLIIQQSTGVPLYKINEDIFKTI